MTDHLSPATAASLLPQTDGRPASTSRVLWWIRHGFNGRKLPALRTGRRYAILADDFTRFVSAMQLTDEAAGAGA